MCLFTIYISSFVKCMFRASLFIKSYFLFLSLSFGSSLYICRYKAFIRSGFANIFSKSVAYISNPLITFLEKQKLLIVLNLPMFSSFMHYVFGVVTDIFAKTKITFCSISPFYGLSILFHFSILTPKPPCLDYLPWKYISTSAI